MDHLTDFQQSIIKRFVDRTTKIIESGYAYAFAHPDAIKTLQCDASRIKEIEAIRRSRPQPCHEKMLRDAYIRYIVKIVRYGLKLIHTNRDMYGDFLELQKVINEFSEAQNNFTKTQRTYHQSIPRYKRNETFKVDPIYTIESDDSTENFFSSTFHQLEDLCTKIDKLRLRVDSMSKMRAKRPKCILKNSHEGMRQLNEDLEEKLKRLKQERLKRLKSAMDSSEDSPSEFVLSYENFVQPLYEKKKPVWVGPIQRNIVIPVKTDNPPNIKPKYYYNRDANGQMTFDINLNFEQGVLMNDKLAKGIYIKSALPARNNWGRS